jgi:uncharacterized membrane protein SirB2
MDHVTLKLIHQTAAALSIAGFIARGTGARAGAAWVRGRAAKSLPHLVDTVLLLSAVAMLWQWRATPSALPWVTAKLIALLVYIGLGVVALRPATRGGTRVAAFVGALASVGYIVGTALSKDPAWVLR